ncbi:hybrid sensor histidine kinase/response regulator transcription factor [Microbacter margulisiae]|uniref:histidine kinase n=1 Tax=Microbacter margulisiae TaxID=1350067 RepID=A0A7W5DT65_9PORP|nr:hybrid sensor histidine kinase/response regulator transcription factor [Microbacter margulisiae]MBB3188624.1 signal transduction histidine kinase/ligand-binding sensor domain-containing protein/DNA-binding response OmpR family regulator [Microbacter margulisiae]
MKRISFLWFTLFCFGILQANNSYDFKRLDIANGLSTNQTRSIFKDSHGFMWFGTAFGLNRYDGSEFTLFQHRRNDATSIPSNNVGAIQEAYDGKLWITTGPSQTIYNPTTETFSQTIQLAIHKLGINAMATHVFIDASKNYWISTSQQTVIVYDVHQKKIIPILSTTHYGSLADLKQVGNRYWLIFNSGILAQYDYPTKKIISQTDFLKQQFAPVTHPFQIFVDNDDDVWIYSQGSDMKGMYLFHPKTNQWEQITSNSKHFPLSSDLVTDIIQDNQGLLWIGTDHGGITLIDKKTGKTTYLENNSDDDRTISHNSITALYKDNDGIIWVTTYKNGICYYHKSVYKFALIHHEASNPNSLPTNDINCFYEDPQKTLWLGTDEEGLFAYYPALKKYVHYAHHDGHNSISSNVVLCINPDTKGNLWIGSFHGGLDRFDGKHFTHFPLYSKGKTPPTNSVYCLLNDSYGNLWVGFFGEGIFLLNAKTGHYTSCAPYINQSGDFRYPTAILEMKSGEILFGSSNGIVSYNPSKKRFTNHNLPNENKWPLSNETINGMIQDSRGWVWIGTNEGITLYQPKNQRFTWLTVKDGLPDNIVQTILEDNQHNMWAATMNGLSEIYVSTSNGQNHFRFCNYDESDGLQSREFNRYAAYKTSNGNLLFGGLNGYNRFSPNDIMLNKISPHILFTSLRVFNQVISPGEKFEGKMILSKPLYDTHTIHLKHTENMFSIEFSAFNFLVPSKTEYEYKLDNFDRQWTKIIGKTGKVTYTNLNPGTYTLLVRAANNDHLWSKQTAKLFIVVDPPFWFTTWAKIIYVLLFALILFLIYKYLVRRAKKKFEREKEIAESKRIHEFDEMKLRFFTNISHEFRTPLSLIINPLEQLVKESRFNEKEMSLFEIMHRNAKQLLQLVNELLDFRKLETSGHQISYSYGDFVNCISDICSSFESLSKDKNISFTFASSTPEMKTQFDEGKVRKIITNLLSNAFKFTPQGGKIEVTLSFTKDLHVNDTIAIIAVADTGIGIPDNEKEKIFERFYQAHSSDNQNISGSGIGLHLCKEFATMLGGSIEVKSETGKGSIFTLQIPLQVPTNDSHGSATEITKLGKTQLQLLPLAEQNIQNKKEITILLVEDNVDFRKFLRINLTPYYTILEAANGKEAWPIILSKLPSLIISDIMMPEMDGITLCKKIKDDERSCSIPVILLTAKNTDQSRIQGFEGGADEYICKPFNMDLLFVRIQGLLHERQEKADKMNVLLNIAFKEKRDNSADNQILFKVISCIEKNMERPDFSVEELSRYLGMTRATLYNKLLAITGKTPVEFIRVIRLKQAENLLKSNQFTISEVAYKVGFNYPKYFRQYFKVEFGVSPKEYIQQNRKANEPVKTKD